MKYTLDDFARLIDHTNLHADATEADMKKLCDEAKSITSRWLLLTKCNLSLFRTIEGNGH